MKVIHLKNQKISGDKFLKEFASDADYDTVIEGDHTVYGPNGELLVIILRNRFPKEMLLKTWSVVKDINLRTDNRGTAAGIEMELVKKKDGTLSNTRAVPKGYDVISGVIGYYPRYPRIPFCRECAWNQQHPEQFQSLLPLFTRVNELHKEYAPESWAYQNEIVQRTSKDFVIPSTIYTTVTVNKNFRTAYHLDAKNAPLGMAPMLLMRQGKFEGGTVVLPEWRIAAKLETGDLILFRNMQDIHGNTKIVPLTKDYQRCTLVFYYREEMVKCGTAAEELERAQSGADYSKDFSEER
jgi:hypothetical protein